jgi:hypothetical protein
MLVRRGLDSIRAMDVRRQVEDADPDDDDEQRTLPSEDVIDDLAPDEEGDSEMPDFQIVGSPIEPIDPGILLASLTDSKKAHFMQKTLEQAAGQFNDILRLSAAIVGPPSEAMEGVTMLKRPLTPTELVMQAQYQLTSAATAAGRISPMTIYRKNSIVDHKQPLEYLAPPASIPPAKSISPPSSPFNTPNRSANASPRQPPLLRPVISYGGASQQGYRRIGTDGTKKPLHDYMEDIEWCEVPQAHPLSTLPCWIHVLADGHGGVEAPRFFVSRMKQEIPAVVAAKPWQFDDADDRHEFSERVKQVFGSLDREYCEYKKGQYLAWRKGGGVLGDKHTLVNGKPRPIDDGCTMVVNVIYGGLYLVWKLIF